MKKKFRYQQFHRSPPNLCEILAWKTDKYLVSNFFFKLPGSFFPGIYPGCGLSPGLQCLLDEKHLINMRPLTSSRAGNAFERAWRKVCLKQAILSFRAHLIHSFAEFFVCLFVLSLFFGTHSKLLVMYCELLFVLVSKGRVSLWENGNCEACISISSPPPSLGPETVLLASWTTVCPLQNGGLEPIELMWCSGSWGPTECFLTGHL